MYVPASIIYTFLHRPKHPLKVHVWAGISLKGPTKIVIFEGMMDAALYVEILETGLLPFLEEKLPLGHRLMQVTFLKITLSSAGSSDQQPVDYYDH